MVLLNDDQIAVIYGGRTSCVMSVLGLGLSIIGAGASFMTLNPFGVILGIGGIYTGGYGVMSSCGFGNSI